MKKIAATALLCLTCNSSPKAVIVLALSYDSSVKGADQIANLQVKVANVVRTYAVPSTAPFGRCTPTAVPPCTLEIDTDQTGQLEITVVGTGESSGGGASVVLGAGSGAAAAEVGKAQPISIQLSCSSGTCGQVIAGVDGGSGDGGNAGTGGSRPDAGAGTGGGGAGTGGIAGRTGAAGTGGTTGVGGTNGIAGSHGTGGATGMGGTRASGGTTGTAGLGGAAGVGDISGTGGVSGLGGTNAAGGIAGAAGSSGTAGAGGTSSPKNCVDTIKLNGYSAMGAQPCSACIDDQTSQATACEAMIDCLDAANPCSGNCATQCANSAGASSVAQGCVNKLLTAAACP